jgi:7,8-dihydroneopterin aldolase/epimerase/oxygenase
VRWENSNVIDLLPSYYPRYTFKKERKRVNMNSNTAVNHHQLTKAEVLQMDQISVKGLEARTIIGVFDWEKQIKQALRISFTVYHPVQGTKDTDLSTTKDYNQMSQDVLDFVEGSQFELIETLAEHIAQRLIRDYSCNGVTVSVEKPGAVRFADSVGVRITRFSSQVKV